MRKETQEELMVLQSIYPDSELIFDGDFFENFEICGKNQNDEIFGTASVEFRVALDEAEITFTLPMDYPTVPPLVLLRCNLLNKEQSNRFGEKIRRQIDQMIIGEPILLDIINWIRENLPKYLKSCETNSDSGPLKCSNDSDEKNFARFWIFCHHLYSKFKRRDLLNLAHRLQLTGFSLPGKPGIICVEGNESACKNFWDEIRIWNWKKISLKNSEFFPLEKNSQEKIFNKFPAFAEQNFNVRPGSGREFHMDMGMFKQYLIDHDCGNLFSKIFGFEKFE